MRMSICFYSIGLSICFFLGAVAVPPVEWNHTIPNDRCKSTMDSLALIDSVTAKKKYSSFNSTERMRIPRFYLLGDSTLRIKSEYAALAGIGEFVIYDGPKDYTLEMWKHKFIERLTLEHMKWADVFVWNIGIHKQGSNFDGNNTEVLHSLGEYESLLRSMTNELLTQVEKLANSSSDLYRKLIYYKLTNKVCSETYESTNWPRVHMMYDPAYTMRPEYEMQLTKVGSPILNYVEKKVMREHNITMLNTFTTNACGCTNEGVHYIPLGSGFVDKLISIAQKDLSMIENAPYNQRA